VGRATPAALRGVAGRPDPRFSLRDDGAGLPGCRHHVCREPDEQGKPDRYATDQSKADFWSCVPLIVEVSIPVARSPGRRMRSAAATALSRLTRIVPTFPFIGLEPITPLRIDSAEDSMARVWNTPVFILATVYFVVDAMFSHVTQPITVWLAKKRLFERVRLWVISLGPYPSLALFAVPVIILEPAKPLAGYLLGTGHFFAGAVTFITAEVLKLTLVERLFQLNREKLLSIPAFAWGYQYWRHMMDVIESMEVWKASRRLVADAARMFRARWIQYKRVRRSSRLHYHP
jgi:hypothetical protein